MITSHYPNVSINTANPPTEMARQDTLQRNLIEPVKELARSAAEKPVSSDDNKTKNQQTSANVTLYDSQGKEISAHPKVTERSEQEPKEQQKQEEQQAEQQKQKELEELKASDLEVKRHEQAHAAIGGQYASSPSYSYETGPDGKQYAVEGEVQIDIAQIPGDAQATVRKMQQVKAAALAPAEPSSTDRQVAAEASRRMQQAQAELVKQKTEKHQDTQSGEKISLFDDLTTEIEDIADNLSAVAERNTLASPEIRQRSSVISGFYQKAVSVAEKHYLQQA